MRNNAHILPRVGHARPRLLRQAGSALLVVVVLLLLASLFVIFALNVGRFEQKTSGNDLRARIAQELAEAGIAQGVEFFNANRTVFATNDNWRLCAADETDFPCGAVPGARRGTMWTYKNAGSGATLAERLVPIPLPFTSAGGYDATQQVGAVLCRVRALPGGGAAAVPTTCTTSATDASSTWVVTVVSKGDLTSEGASSTVTQTVGAYNLFNVSTGIPPLVASGGIAVGGGLQIVAAPDAAGPNVPVSVWTRLDMAKNGTPNTCYFDEFLRQGGTSSGPAYYDGIAVCHTCSCPGDGSLSYPKSGNQACEGMDIVDIDNNVANDCTTAPNLDIRREEFPKDLFAFLFGQRAWDDIDRDGIAVGAACTFDAKDCHFGEQRRVSACTYPDPATGANRTAALPEDTCYLLNIKNKLHIGDGVNDAAECAALGADTSGVVWVHSQAILDMPGYDCETTIRGLDQFGKPSKPVALVYDGVLTQVHFQFYGLLFIREPNGSTTLDPDTGGSGELGLNAGATIYGAAVIQGRVTSGGGGTAAIVYNKDVLFNLINDPDNITPASLPGSWTDRLRY